MDSTITAVRSLSVLRRVTTGLLSCLMLIANAGMAQRVSGLGNLILEPVLLSSALDSPLDLTAVSATDTQALLDSISNRLAAIEALRRDGSSNPQIIEQLGMLAIDHQRLDRHEAAIDVLDEAIALTFEAGGRDNLEQIPLQEQKLASYLALDDIRSIDDTEELIYSLYQRSFGPLDRQMYYATINLADWHTTAYYRENYSPGSLALKRQRAVIPRVQRCIRRPGSLFGENASGCEDFAIFNGNIKDVFNQDIIDARLRKIDRLYSNYQNVLLESGNAQLDIIIDMAKRIARLAYATKQEMDFERDNYTFDPNYEGSREQAARNSPDRMDESYDTGVKALKYAITVPGSVADWRPEALAAALLDLGDWHLAYGKAAAAEEAYGQAYEVLLEAGFSAENIERALATDLPITLPVFATHLYTRRSTGRSEDAELDYKGYVDLSYTVDQLGNARGLDFIGRSDSDSDEIEKIIERQLRTMKFRPVLSNGQLTSPGRIEARYYYAY